MDNPCTPNTTPPGFLRRKTIPYKPVDRGVFGRNRETHYPEHSLDLATPFNPSTPPFSIFAQEYGQYTLFQYRGHRKNLDSLLAYPWK